MTDMPVFLTTEAEFLGIGCEPPKASMDRYRGEKKFEGFPEPPARHRLVTVYIDGQLDRDSGFDIPAWARGTIKWTPRQDCMVVGLDGKERAAVLVLASRLEKDHDDEKVKPRFAGYIVYPEDADRIQETLRRWSTKEYYGL